MSRPVRTTQEQFDALTAEGERGCVIWTGAVLKGGYGVFTPYQGGITPTRLAHRWVYEQRNGAVPDGLVLDHLCRVRHCVNVDHLEAVTQQTNVRRGARCSA